MNSLEVIRKHRRWTAMWALAWAAIVGVAIGLCASEGARDWFTQGGAVIAGVVVGCLIAPGAAIIWLHHRMELRLGLKCRKCRHPMTLENQKVIIRVTGCCGNCGSAVSTSGQHFVLLVDGQAQNSAITLPESGINNDHRVEG